MVKIFACVNTDGTYKPNEIIACIRPFGSEKHRLVCFGTSSFLHSEVWPLVVNYAYILAVVGSIMLWIVSRYILAC